MKTDKQIVEAMHREHCYQGMIELYHAWFGLTHTYVYYNQETLYIMEDLEAPLNDFTFKQFLSDDKIIELMEKNRQKYGIHNTDSYCNRSHSTNHNG